MIQSWDEADRELRKLRDEINAMKIGDIDALSRRIVNLQPSRDPNDAVARVEMMQLFKQQVPNKKESVGTSEEVGVFGCFIGVELLVAKNVCPPHIVKRSGSIKKVYATLEESAIGGYVSFNLRKNEEYKDTNSPASTVISLVSLLETTKFLPPYVIDVADLDQDYPANFNLSPEDIVTIDIVSVGGTYQGKSLLVKFTY